MSWGERSCINRGKCPIPEECKMSTCNVSCKKYLHDGVTTPDSYVLKIEPDRTEQMIGNTRIRTDGRCSMCFGEPLQHKDWCPIAKT